MEIRFNGKQVRLEKEASVRDFLILRGVNPNAGYIAVARNEMIIKRAEWPELILKDGDRLEIIQAVQGG